VLHILIFVLYLLNGHQEKGGCPKATNAIVMKDLLSIDVSKEGSPRILLCGTPEGDGEGAHIFDKSLNKLKSFMDKKYLCGKKLRLAYILVTNINSVIYVIMKLRGAHHLLTSLLQPKIQISIYSMRILVLKLF
jgi:hypothetical protein